MTDEILHRVPHAAKPPDDPLVTGMRLGNAILHAVRGPAVYADAGTTVAHFLAALEALGVTLSDPLASIEYGVSGTGVGLLRVERDAAGALDVHEVSRSEIA